MLYAEQDVGLSLERERNNCFFGKKGQSLLVITHLPCKAGDKENDK